MRSLLCRVRIAFAGGLTVAALAWMLPPLGARGTPRDPGIKPAPRALMAGGMEEPPPPRVYFRAPITAEAAAVWIKLQQKIPVKYDHPITLGDLLKTINAATRDKDMPDGLSIYITPVGLQDHNGNEASAELTNLNLGNVRIETALKLALEQLDCKFTVHPDGIIVISAVNSTEPPSEDPDALILDRLESLQKQVKELRDLVAPREMPPSALQTPAKK